MARLAGQNTRAVHGGEVPDAATGAVNVPIHLSSTFRYPELPGGQKSPYIYSRYANPTVEAVEAKLAAIEGAAGALLFSSGMAAVNAVAMSHLCAGDGVVVQGGVYGQTTAYLREWERFGVTVQRLPPGPRPPVVPKGTKLVWMESITNPLLRVGDVALWAKAAHQAGARLCVDATFATPILQRPLEWGADLVMHSATKYLGGHSDLLAGCVLWGEGFASAPVAGVRRSQGGCLDPHAAFLLGRGAKTLGLRVERHCENALELATACEAKGITVHYPGLESHPDHAVARRLLTGGFGGVVTLDLKTAVRAVAFRRRVQVVAPASSLGGVESLVSLPSETSHAYSSAAERRREGIGDGLVRISVGIEDAEDLVRDVLRAAK
ncbi:MAG: trans-sulfuration enzyme family protein [Thermoplasmatota archaeon]